MRILYLADIRFPLERANGIQSMATCHALASLGHEATLIVRPDTHVPARDPYAFYGLPRIPALHIEVAPITGPPAARRAGYVTFTIGRALGRARQDLIFTRDLGLASLLVRVPAVMRAPIVYEAHTIAADAAAARPDLLTDAAKASPAKLERLAKRDARVWRDADGYVTITAGLARELERRFGPRPRIAIVPDGVRAAATDTALATDSSQPTDSSQATDYTDLTDRGHAGPDPRPSAPGPTRVKPFTIGYAGHLYPWKGVELIIEAVAALPETRGLIVGGHDQEPDLARIKQLAVQLDCATRVTFTGALPPPDVAGRLREADVLILPNRKSAISTEFTSPLKLFEYMASGRPIVASDLPSLREVLQDGANALLFEAGNPTALVAGITRLKNDPALGARLARQARDDVREFTWARRAERLETLFREVTGVAR